jgi:hypothetical protein
MKINRLIARASADRHRSRGGCEACELGREIVGAFREQNAIRAVGIGGCRSFHGARASDEHGDAGQWLGSTDGTADNPAGSGGLLPRPERTSETEGERSAGRDDRDPHKRRLPSGWRRSASVCSGHRPKHLDQITLCRCGSFLAAEEHRITQKYWTDCAVPVWRVCVMRHFEP